MAVILRFEAVPMTKAIQFCLLLAASAVAAGVYATGYQHHCTDQSILWRDAAVLQSSDWLGRLRMAERDPPDIQPAAPGQNPLFGVTKKAFDGRTYLGMVTRDNESHERVAQNLTQPLLKGRCYAFSIYLCRSVEYLSASHNNSNIAQAFSTPIVLRIYSGDAYCHQKELLAESALVENTDWSSLTLPQSDVGLPLPRTGGFLQDTGADALQWQYPDWQGFRDPQDPPARMRKYRWWRTNRALPKSPGSILPERLKIQATDPRENKILKSLDKDKIKVGQSIRIEKLFFKSDSSNIDPPPFRCCRRCMIFWSPTQGQGRNRRPHQRSAAAWILRQIVGIPGPIGQGFHHRQGDLSGSCHLPRLWQALSDCHQWYEGRQGTQPARRNQNN